MKKIFNWALGLSIIALTLTGCGQNNPSTTSAADDTTSAADTSDKTTKIDPTTESSKSETTEGEDTSNTEDTSEETSPWSADELKLMKDNLDGIVLPHPGYDDLSMALNDEGRLEILSASNGHVNEDAANYAAALAEAGWTDETGEYDHYYTLKRVVETKDGDRYLNCFVSIVDEQGWLTEEGYFNIIAYDPYFYEWPTDFVDYVLELYESEASVPAYDKANVYQAEESWGTAYIDCYTDDVESENEYTELLKNANYDVADERDMWGWNTAVAPTEDLEIGWAYDTWDSVFTVKLTKHEKPTSWPAEDVAALVNGLVEGSETVIPAYPGEHYWGISDWYNEIDVTDVDETSFSTYLDVLEKNKWTLDYYEFTEVDPDDEYSQAIYFASLTSPEKDIALDLKWEDGWGLEIYLKLPPEFTQFPLKEVQEIYGDLNDELPVFPNSLGIRGFDFEESFGTCYVKAYLGKPIDRVQNTWVKRSQANTILRNSLESQGFIFDAHNELWNSPNGGYGFRYYCYDGLIEIDFLDSTLAKDFPLNEVNDFLYDYKFGFTLTTAMQIYEKGCFVTSYTDWWFGTYTVIEIATYGDFAQQYNQQLAFTLQKGYETYTIDEMKGYLYYKDADGINNFCVGYDEETNMTVVSFMHFEADPIY